MILKMDARFSMNTRSQYKILIVRLSSFGDIIQAMSCLSPIKGHFQNAKIHWLARSDMAPLLEMTDTIDRVWSYNRKTGFKGLLSLGFELRKEGFTHIYDAHCNLRSFVLKMMLWSPRLNLVTRSKERWKRFLLFQCRINTFEKPYRGLISYLKPLSHWSIPLIPTQHKFQFSAIEVKKIEELRVKEKICLAPSAAWEMKRWPLGHWKKLIDILPQHEFVILGGPTDDFCEELRLVAPDRVINTAGKLSLRESCLAVQESALVISADTGLLHVADLIGVPGLALIGPTAFGFPTHQNIEVLEKLMPCRPCTKDGRGHCSQPVYQKCLVDISAEEVAQRVRALIPR